MASAAVSDSGSMTAIDQSRNQISTFNFTSRDGRSRPRISAVLTS
jgi:hypothetical protein